MELQKSGGRLANGVCPSSDVQSERPPLDGTRPSTPVIRPATLTISDRKIRRVRAAFRLFPPMVAGLRPHKLRLTRKPDGPQRFIRNETVAAVYLMAARFALLPRCTRRRIVSGSAARSADLMVRSACALDGPGVRIRKAPGACATEMSSLKAQEARGGKVQSHGAGTKSLPWLGRTMRESR